MKADELAVEIKAKLTVDKATAMGCLALLRIFCLETGAEIVKDKDIDGTDMYCLMGPKISTEDIQRRDCSTCDNVEYPVPQCQECSAENGYKWFIPRKEKKQ